MRIHRLALEGIGPYAARQELDFDALSSSGLFLLTGPTGAGKTTILDGIVYALYGTVPGVRGAGSRGERATSERIVSDLRSPDTQPHVELEFTVSGRRLRIGRVPQHLRPKARGEGLTIEKSTVALSELVDGEWVARSSDPAEVGSEILGLLGMSAAQFAQVVLLPQGEFAGFLRAGVKDRQAVLERLFRIDRFQTAEAWFDERAREASARLAEAEGALAGIVDQLAGALGASAGVLPQDRSLDGIEQWIAERRFEAEELHDLAGVAADGASTVRTDAEQALRRTEALLAAQAAAQQREQALASEQTRLPGARTWIADHEEQALASDEARWPAAAQAAHALHARLLERQGDADRIAQLASQASDAEAQALAAEQQAQEAQAAVQTLAGALRRAQEAASDAERAEQRVTAIEAERDRIAAALAAAERASTVASQLDAARREAEALDGALARHQAAIDALPAPAEAERALEAAGAQASQLELAVSEQRLQRTQAQDALRQLSDTLTRWNTLQADLQTARAALTHRLQAWQDARAAHLDARAARLDAMAAELSSALTDGEPCPVCGSAEHPAPAPPDGGGDRRAAEARAEAVANDAHAAHERAAAQVAGLEGQLAALGTRETLEAHQAQAEARLTALSAAITADASAAADAAQSLARCREQLEQVRAAHDARERSHYELRRLRERCELLSTTLAAERTAAGPDPLTREHLVQAEAELERLRGLRAAAAAARDEVAATEARQEAARARAVSMRESSAGHHAAARAARDQAAALAAQLQGLIGAHDGFAEALAAASTRAHLLGEAAKIVAACATASAELAAATAEAAAAAQADPIADGEPTAPEERRHLREQRLAAAEAERDEAVSRLRDAARHLSAIAHAKERWEQARAALGPAAEEAERVQRLDAVVRGQGDNRRRISLTTYVLAARLEEVAAAATAHLQRMSGGRYALLHHDERFGNGPAGLGLRVLDAYSGEERETATLSGGEAFYTSLALALGLADVVQREAGGRPLETLLVDEGFGSLDAETLEEVLGELDELRAAGRAIGLVSHVPALAERITAQLQVTPERGGSRARVVVAGAVVASS